MNVAAKPQPTFKLEAVHPDPSQAHKMPYAPAIKIVGACDLMFLSGATSSPLYHNHPHQDHEHIHPHSIEEQTKNAMNAIQSILESVGATWKDVIKVTKYLTDFREADAMHKTMHAYFGDWLPASTTVCINQLSSPGARSAPSATGRRSTVSCSPAISLSPTARMPRPTTGCTAPIAMPTSACATSFRCWQDEGQRVCTAMLTASASRTVL